MKPFLFSGTDQCYYSPPVSNKESNESGGSLCFGWCTNKVVVVANEVSWSLGSNLWFSGWIGRKPLGVGGDDDDDTGRLAGEC